MREAKNNWVLILKIHAVFIIVLLLPVFLFRNEYRDIFLILAIVLVFSLLVQIFIYLVKPALYGDKNKRGKSEIYTIE